MDKKEKQLDAQEPACLPSEKVCPDPRSGLAETNFQRQQKEAGKAQREEDARLIREGQEKERIETQKQLAEMNKGRSAKKATPEEAAPKKVEAPKVKATDRAKSAKSRPAQKAQPKAKAPAKAPKKK